MNGHGYVTLPSWQGGAVLGDLDVSPCAAWSTGHRPSFPSERGPLQLFLLDAQTSWANPFWRSPGVSAKGGQVHFIDQLTLVWLETNGLDDRLLFLWVGSVTPLHVLLITVQGTFLFRDWCPWGFWSTRIRPSVRLRPPPISSHSFGFGRS